VQFVFHQINPVLSWIEWRHLRALVSTDVTGTSPDFVQSLVFFMSRFLSGTTLQSGLSLDKIKNIENLKKLKNLKKWLTLIGKSWKTHPEFFLKFSFPGSSHRPFYWKTHPFEFFEWNHIWYVAIGMDEFSSKMACVTPQNSPIDDWISFPVKRSSSRPCFKKTE